MLGECIVKRIKLSKMHKDAEEMEALCQPAVRDGGLRQMVADQIMLQERLWSPVLQCLYKRRSAV